MRALTFAIAASSVLTLASAASHNNPTGKVSASTGGEGTGERTGKGGGVPVLLLLQPQGSY